MTITLRRVTGPVVLPTGEAPAFGRIELKLSGWDRELGQLVLPGPVSGNIDGGLVDLDIWAADQGEHDLTYTGAVIWYDQSAGMAVRHSLPITISVPAGAVDLVFADLVVSEVTESTQADALAQAQAAAVSALASAARAEAAVTVYASIAAAEATSVSAEALRLVVLSPLGMAMAYVRDATDSTTAALQTADGAKWKPDGDYTPYHYGAQGDGLANDTDAFAAMFAAYEAEVLNSTTVSTARNVFGSSVEARINLTSGRFIVNKGWKPSTPAGRIMKIVGNGPTEAVIVMPVDGTTEYLIDQQDRTNGATPFSYTFHHLHCSGFKLIGGKGLYINREPDAPYMQRGTLIEDVDIIGFTECGYASLWGDDPLLTLSRVRIETIAHNTIGLYLPRGVANPAFSDVTIVGCRYKVVLAPGFQSLSFVSGLTTYSLPGDDHEADIWCKTIPTTDPNNGIGVVITGNRFGSENRNGKPVLLIADASGVGEEQAQLHLSTASSRRFRDWKFEGNVVSGQGTADVAPAGPMIVSYTADIGAAQICDNSCNVGFSKMLQINNTPSQNGAVGLRIGPNQFGGGGEPPEFCNLDIGTWVSGDGCEVPSRETPLLSVGGRDPGYLVVSVNSAGDPLNMGTVTAGGVSLVNTAPHNVDTFGFANSRAVIYNSSADYVEMLSDPTQIAALGLAANENYFIEFWHKTTGSNDIKEVDVEVLLTVSTGATLRLRQSFRPTSKWLPFRLAIPSHLPPTGFRVRWYPSPDAWSAATDRFVLAEPIAYRANRPISRGPLFPPVYRKAALAVNSAAYSKHGVIMVLDDAGGQTLAFSDGVSWRRVSDRAIIS